MTFTFRGERLGNLFVDLWIVQEWHKDDGSWNAETSISMFPLFSSMSMEELQSLISECVGHPVHVMSFFTDVTGIGAVALHLKLAGAVFPPGFSRASRSKPRTRKRRVETVPAMPLKSRAME